MNDNFDLEILRRGNSYLFIARAFGVAVSNDDMQAGIEEARKRIAEVQELYREAGLDPQLSAGWRPRRKIHLLRGPEPARDEVNSPRLMEFVLPTLVSGVVLASFILLATVPLFSVLARLNRTLEDVSAVTSTAMIENFGHNAIEVFVRTGDAMDRVTPQRKEELRQAVRKIMNGLAPIIQEVGDSVERNPPTTPPAR